LKYFSKNSLNKFTQFSFSAHICWINIIVCIFRSYLHQAPAVYRKIPVYRDWTQIPIPGFLKIKYRYFSGFLYSMCVLKLPAREDAKSHWLHLFGFFLHCAFSCVSSNGLPERMQSHIGYICLTFPHCACSCVSSNCLPERMQSHIGCICFTSGQLAYAIVETL